MLWMHWLWMMTPWPIVWTFMWKSRLKCDPKMHVWPQPDISMGKSSKLGAKSCRIMAGGGGSKLMGTSSKKSFPWKKSWTAKSKPNLIHNSVVLGRILSWLGAYCLGAFCLTPNRWSQLGNKSISAPFLPHLPPCTSCQIKMICYWTSFISWPT